MTDRLIFALRCAAILCVIAMPVSAATWFAGDFLAVGIGPRAISMGGSVLPTVSGTDATYWNPAGLADSRETSYSFEHAERFSGIVSHDAFGAALPLTSGTLGLTLFRGAIDGIVYSDSTTLADPNAPLSSRNLPDLSKTRTFSNADYTFHLAYGRSLTSTLKIGAGVKLIRRTLDNRTAFGYGLDIGAQWVAESGLSVGLTVRDAATTRVVWDGGRTDVVYPTVNVGTGYTWHIPEYESRLTVSAGSVYGSEAAGYSGFAPWMVMRERNPGVVGAEYEWRNIIALRMGTRDLRGLLGPGSSQLTAGVGINAPVPWSNAVNRVGIDLSWMRHTLNDSYRIGTTVQL